MIPILWKEFKALQTSLVTLVFHFVTPLFLLVFFATVMNRNVISFDYAGSAVKYLDFFTPGLVGYVTFMTFQLALTFIRHDKMSGILAIIVLSRGDLAGYLGGKLAAHLVINVFKIAALIALATLLSGSGIALLRPANAAMFLLAVCLGTTIWLTLGLATALLLPRDDIREMLTMLLTLPLVFASSMYYDVSRAPSWIQTIAGINPITYTCNIARRAYLRPDMGAISSDLGILVLMTVIAISLAVFVSRRIDY
jgi:ABC-2 type transport system permease protein